VIEIAGIRKALESGSRFALVRKSDGARFEAKNELDPRSRRIILAGGLAAYTRQGGQ
jgi:hypothetical protein